MDFLGTEPEGPEGECLENPYTLKRCEISDIHPVCAHPVYATVGRYCCQTPSKTTALQPEYAHKCQVRIYGVYVSVKCQPRGVSGI